MSKTKFFCFFFYRKREIDGTEYRDRFEDRVRKTKEEEEEEKTRKRETRKDREKKQIKECERIKRRRYKKREGVRK